MRRDLLSGQAIGPYRILELCSEDALGRGYIAEHPRLGARVAVKVLTREPALGPDALERFFREARAVNALRHARIADILDLGTLDDGRAFVVTEHLEGAPLSRLLEERGPLPPAPLARLAADVLDAVAAAHEHGVVHGELSPERIFVTTEGRAKVLDFGAAGLAARGEVRARRSRPQPAASAARYRAPEQAAAQVAGEPGPRVDLYAIGAILDEGLAGAPPASVPAALESVIRRATATDPAARFAGAREMAAALEAAARELPPGEPLDVSPLPLARGRGPRDRRLAAWLLLAAVASLAAALTVAALARALG